MSVSRGGCLCARIKRWLRNSSSTWTSACRAQGTATSSGPAIARARLQGCAGG